MHGRKCAAHGQIVALVDDLLHQLDAAAHDVHDLVRDVARDTQRDVKIVARGGGVVPALVIRLARAQLLVDLKDHVVRHLAQLLGRLPERLIVRAQRLHGQRAHRRRQRRHDRAHAAGLRLRVGIRHRGDIVADRQHAELRLGLPVAHVDHVVAARRVDHDLFLFFCHGILRSPRA